MRIEHSMRTLEAFMPATLSVTSAGRPGPPMSTPGRHGGNDQHIVLDPAQDFIRNTADEDALEERESAGSDNHQIGPMRFATCSIARNGELSCEKTETRAESTPRRMGTTTGPSPMLGVADLTAVCRATLCQRC
jgi:hypothetical protein